MIIKKKDLFKSVLINLLIITLYTISNNPKYLFIFYGIGVIFIIIEFLDGLCLKNRLIVAFHTKATFVFLVICTFSLFWSIEPAYDYYKFLVFNFFLMFAINNYIDNREKLDKTIKSLILAGLVMSIHVLLVSGCNFKLGNRLLIEGYNANSIGMYLSLSLLACIYFFDKHHNIKYLIPLVLFMPVIFFSGSKKALFLVAFFVAFYTCYKKKGAINKIRNMIIAILLVGIIVYFVFSIPWVYKIMGTRILDLINSVITGQLGQDEIRFYMIRLGIEKFKEKPLIGYGLGNYRILLNKEAGFYAYAHNNFIEVLTGMGLVGFLSYYIIYFNIIKNLIKSYRKDTNIVVLLLAVMIGLVISEVGLVSYYVTFYQLIVALSFIGLRIVNNSVDKKVWVVKK